MSYSLGRRPEGAFKPCSFKYKGHVIGINKACILTEDSRYRLVKIMKIPGPLDSDKIRSGIEKIYTEALLRGCDSKKEYLIEICGNWYAAYPNSYGTPLIRTEFGFLLEAIDCIAKRKRETKEVPPAK